MRRFQPSLQLIIATSFGLLLLLCISLLSIVIEEIAAQKIRSTAEERLIDLVHQVADNLDRSMFERYREISLIATTHPTLRAPERSAATERELLEALQESYANYAWIGLTDPDGLVVAATDGILEGADVSIRPWFQAALTGPYVGDVHEALLLAEKLSQIQMADGGPLRFIDIAAPIVDGSGETIGVLGAHIDWSWVYEVNQALTQALSKSQGLEILVVGKSGTVLLGPSALRGTVLSADIITNTDKSLPDFTMSEWPDGITYLTAFMQTQGYQAYPGLGWLILARQPARFTFAQIARLRFQTLLIGLFVTLLGMLIAWWLSRRLTRQLTSITDAATQIGEGAIGVKFPILDGSSEVATLSHALNQLITELTTATTTERNRIARELHDSVTQTLFSSSMLAEMLPKVWETDPALGKAKSKELRIAVRGAQAEMRTLLLELRPSAVIDTEWPRLLRQLAEATRGRAGVTVDWAINGKCELPEQVKLTLYRVAQESLNNIAKYANATDATVRLTCQTEATSLIIVDNGQGFDSEATIGDHFGLTMMRERVQAIGGELSIVSKLDEGTEVRVLWHNNAA